MTNALPYLGSVLITPVKSFIVYASGCYDQSKSSLELLEAKINPILTKIIFFLFKILEIIYFSVLFFKAEVSLTNGKSSRIYTIEGSTGSGEVVKSVIRYIQVCSN